MGLRCGIVGLPNVGKSTLFNALTETANAEAQNYPFCTIEPNVGRIAVPDERLENLARMAKSAMMLPNQIDIVDIAGLVKGASQGEGLGNQFLGNIRETDAILHVLRCFDHTDITHVEGSIDPIRDMHTVEMELMLSDLDSVIKRIQRLEKRSRSGDAEAQKHCHLLTQIQKLLDQGLPARLLERSEEDHHIIRQFQLLTDKPVLYVCNVSEEDIVNSSSGSNIYTQKVTDHLSEINKMRARAHTIPDRMVILSANIESEISLLSLEERKEFLSSMGLQESGLAKVVKGAYALLDLLTFFTVGPKEARAWSIYKNAKAPEAAGVIHSDFERGFIRAETISYEDYITYQGEQGAKANGKMRLEGKEYIVKDGDIFHFLFNV